MKEVLNVGVIGLGNRGSSLLENCILPQPGVRVLAVCDNYEDRREKAAELVTAAARPAARAAADYREVLAMPKSTLWSLWRRGNPSEPCLRRYARRQVYGRGGGGRIFCGGLLEAGAHPRGNGRTPA